MKTARPQITALCLLALLGSATSTLADDEIAPQVRAPAQPDNGWGPYQAAITAGDPAGVTRLIDLGLRVDLKEAGPWGRTLLHLTAATSSKHPKESVKIANLLIKAGADVNAPMRSGLTPLHEAARSGTKDFVALLIKKGAKVNPQIKVKNCLDPDYDAQDATPLDLARKRDDIEIIALLEIRGGRSGQEKAPAKN